MKLLKLLVLAVCILALRPLVQAQNFSVLYSFTESDGTNGSSPRTSLVFSGNNLYGVAPYGATSEGDPPGGSGTIFAVKTDGTGITILHDFTAVNPSTGKNNDGALPDSELFLSGNTLYGTAGSGGANGDGTLFAVDTNGTNFTTLLNFNSSESRALSLSTLSGNALYGTSDSGSYGSIIDINTTGTNFTTLFAFNGSDGSVPGALILSGNVFYGSAGFGGEYGGEVFMVATNGNNFTRLYTFTNGNDGWLYGNSQPGSLISSGNMLYGIANGGTNGTGTIFAVTTNGMVFSLLYSFSAGAYDAASGYYTNSDGANPSGLIVSGNTLYGTANAGGADGYGTVFAISTDGTGFTTLHSFNGEDGAGPMASPILSGNTLYGTTSGIATYPGLVSVYGDQTVFSLTLPPTLEIAVASNEVVISWTISAANYVLQTTTNVISGPWSSITSGITTNGLDYSFGNAMTQQAAYFRLQQQ